MGIVVLLIAVGFVLIALETVLPGLIVGTLGFFSICAGVIYAYVHFGFRAGNTVLAASTILLMVGAVLWVKFFPESAMARVFVSTRQIGNVNADKPELLGQSGTTVTALRPAGLAMLNGKRVDVVSDGAFIEKGRAVKVVGIEGLRVVVRAIEQA
jgi:membrane-bound serine protease (ClpP class)